MTRQMSNHLLRHKGSWRWARSIALKYGAYREQFIGPNDAEWDEIAMCNAVRFDCAILNGFDNGRDDWSDA